MEIAQITLSQLLIELGVRLFAHATKDNPPMVNHALTVEPDNSLIQTTSKDVLLRLVTSRLKSSEPTLVDVRLAHMVTSQTPEVMTARELSQNVVALRSMTQLVTTAYHAQHSKLPPTTTVDVSQDNAQSQTRLSELLRAAMLADHARRDPPQTD